MKDSKQEDIIKSDTVIFFDMDGTLVDTDYSNFLSFQTAINSVLSPTKVIRFNPNERFNRTILKREYPNISEEDYKDIIQLKESLYIGNLKYTKLIQNVFDILVKFKETNITVLVTNCREERATITLNHHRLINMFKHRFYRKTIEKDRHINKFQNALNSLNLNPENVVAFENEAFEIDEATKAGIKIINPKII